MTKSRFVAALGIMLIVLLGLFIANNTYWEDIPIPTPAKGEAITNPFYAAQRFAEELGATTRRDRSLMVPSPQSVIVLSVWHWDLSPQRQAALRRWVESGGRLVVDRAISGDLSEFKSWSGLEWDYNEEVADAYHEEHDEDEYEECAPVEEVAPQQGPSYSMCGLDFSFVKTERPMSGASRRGGSRRFASPWVRAASRCSMSSVHASSAVRWRPRRVVAATCWLARGDGGVYHGG
jgi:hypothetical protein